MDLSQITPLLTSQAALLAAIGFGAMAAVFGMGRMLTDKGPAAERMAPRNRLNIKGPENALNDDDRHYDAFTNANLPESAEERFAITIALA